LHYEEEFESSCGWCDGVKERKIGSFFGGAEEEIRAWDCFLVKRERPGHTERQRRRDSQRHREGEVGRRYRKA
jgi:hypothetical protein